jgi:hypothetical protein
MMFLLTLWRKNPKVHHRTHNSPQFPRLCVVFGNKYWVLWGGLIAPAQPPSWRTTHCRLSATAYSIYSQLPSTSGSRLLYPRHAVVTVDPLKFGDVFTAFYAFTPVTRCLELASWRFLHSGWFSNQNWVHKKLKSYPLLILVLALIVWFSKLLNWDKTNIKGLASSTASSLGLLWICVEHGWAIVK